VPLPETTSRPAGNIDRNHRMNFPVRFSLTIISTELAAVRCGFVQNRASCGTIRVSSSMSCALANRGTTRQRNGASRIGITERAAASRPNCPAGERVRRHIVVVRGSKPSARDPHRTRRRGAPVRQIHWSDMPLLPLRRSGLSV